MQRDGTLRPTCSCGSSGTWGVWQPQLRGGLPSSVGHHCWSPYVPTYVETSTWAAQTRRACLLACGWLHCAAGPTPRGTQRATC